MPPSDDEICRLLVDVISAVREAIPPPHPLDLPPGTPCICRRCGAELGITSELMIKGKSVKALQVGGLALTDARGRCIKCGAKVNLGCR